MVMEKLSKEQIKLIRERDFAIIKRFDRKTPLEIVQELTKKIFEINKILGI